MSSERATPEELAREAAEWDSGEATMAGWKADLKAESDTVISMRVPPQMLLLIREFAQRSGIRFGYNVNIRRINALKQNFFFKAIIHLP